MKRPSAKITAVAVLAAVIVIGLVVSQDDRQPTPADGIAISDVAARSRELIAYNRVSLTPAQEAVKRSALSALPAPCCSNYSAYTCCCPCNMAKTIWGLSNHLIVDKGYAAEQVRAEVRDWIAAINPAGFSGDSCFTGGCEQPFRRNGCGGMSETRLALD